MKATKCWTTLLLTAGSALLGGCLGTSSPSRFYLLTPLDATTVEATSAELDGPSVFLAAVELPKHLLDPQIATRIDRNELGFAEFDRWGEPLKDSFTRVLARNLSLLLPDSQVTTFLWERPRQVDRLVTVVVTRFDAQGEEVVLSARWTVAGEELAAASTFKRSEYLQPVQGEGYGAIVQSMSEALAALSRDIGAEIRSR